MRPMLARRVEPEALDALAPDDPLARGARTDLQRVHRVMRTGSVLQAAIERVQAPSPAQQRWLEIGAGDASLLARLAPALARRWPAVELTLLDRQPCVASRSSAQLASQGWRVRQRVADVFDALDGDASRFDLVIASLFLHHFDGRALERLLRLIAARTSAFVACEPRRSRLALLGSHLVGALGANRVTRQDAVLSVHAGFIGTELSNRWPPHGWRLAEYRALPFTHCFTAQATQGSHAV